MRVLPKQCGTLKRCLPNSHAKRPKLGLRVRSLSGRPRSWTGQCAVGCCHPDSRNCLTCKARSTRTARLSKTFRFPAGHREYCREPALTSPSFRAGTTRSPPTRSRVGTLSCSVAGRSAPATAGASNSPGRSPAADNPLTARVLVNRLWHYLFGSGIVSTVDNFGTTGEKPSHPLLLDYLAARFVDNGWSIKETVRLMVLSRAYRMTTQASPASQSTDPENRLLQHQNVRRLPAESIRDGILETSGDLDRAMYGPSIGVYFVGKTEGVRDKGPLDGGRRRSVYQAIRRNAQNPLLEVFDAPKPSTTRGRRDVTNIPAQSLALLNDPFVVSQAARWADRALADGAIAPRDRVIRMFRRALGRVPDAEETDMLMTSLAAFARERGLARRGWLGSRDLWADYAQSLFNLKEFIYLR